jgi:hypothetical protein
MENGNDLKGNEERINKIKENINSLISNYKSQLIDVNLKKELYEEELKNINKQRERIIGAIATLQDIITNIIK